MTTDRRPWSTLGDRRGVAMIELAFVLPLLVFTIMGLAELCNYGLQMQRLSQIALQVADNAGRLDASDFRGPQKLTEAQINDVLLGGTTAANNLDFARDGRIILSSLELNGSKGQWLHWQRCRGGLAFQSSYGREGDGSSGTSFNGMGRTGAKIVAEPDHPVMFVEVAYKWQPITPIRLMEPFVITEIASMPVRAERDVSGIQNGTAVPVSSC